MAKRQLSGLINWSEQVITPSITPVKQSHLTEVKTYIDKVYDEIQNHKSEGSITAHASATTSTSGYVTPAIYKRIEALKTAVADLDSKINSTIPPGLIVPWVGSYKSTPANWTWCNGENSTPDTRHKYFLCPHSSSTTYPIHSTSTYACNNIRKYFSLTQHSHSFEMCLFTEADGYAKNSGTKVLTSKSKSVGSKDTDYDNAYACATINTGSYGSWDGSYSETNKNATGSFLPQSMLLTYIMRNIGSAMYKVTVSYSAGSSVTIKLNGISLSGSRNYKEGSILKIEATPSTGHTLVSIKVNGTEVENNSYIYVDKTYSIVVTTEK